MTNFVIEENVPVPPVDRRSRRGLGAIQKVLESLNVGQSFAIKVMDRRTANNHCYRAAKRTGFRFTYRQIEGGVRFWRIED